LRLRIAAQEGYPLGDVRSCMLSFDEVITFVGQWPHLRLLAIDGLPLAGKTGRGRRHDPRCRPGFCEGERLATCKTML
jgi:hypothetical protein